MKTRRPSHATVVAYLALFAALSGSAYAVSKVGTGDLKRGAVTSPKVKNHTLTGEDIRPVVLRQQKRVVTAGNTAMSDAVAHCLNREELVSGAGGWISDGNVTSTTTNPRTGVVQVRGTNPDGSADTLVAQAICIRR
jgi:hypothetical protein